MSASEEMSLELATDLARVFNDVRDIDAEASRSFADATRLYNLGYSLGPTALIELGDAAANARVDLDYAQRVVPNFYGSVVQPNRETPASPETLTPEEQAFAESLLVNFKSSYRAYRTAMMVMNNSEKGQAYNEKLEAATEAEAKSAVEALLTPGVIRHAMAEIKETAAIPENSNNDIGFDIVFVPNTDLAEDDGDALETHIKTLSPFFKELDGKSDSLQGQITARKEDVSTTAKLIAVLAPRHLNMRSGSSAKQIADLNEHNQRSSSEAKLQAADDITAMIHILALIVDGVVDVKDPRCDTSRFWATTYRNFTEKPVDDCVTITGLSLDGRFVRLFQPIDSEFPTRVLVVPKS